VITGSVAGRRALVRLVLRGPGGQEAEIEFVLDTGFVGFLTLPPAAVAALSLPFVAPQIALLADRSRTWLDLHSAVALWDGEERDVEVLAMEGQPLLGTSLLDDHDVQIQFTDGGLVMIERL
jgi:clan AA aspartic protease